MIRGLLSQLKETVAPSPVPVWIRVAQREIGVREIRGGETKRIIEYHKATSLKATEDEVAWCSSFANWVLKQCGMQRSHSAAARSWLGVHRRLPGYKKYAIVVFKRGNSSWQGHVGFAMDLKGGYVRCLGGNQSDSVSYANYPASSVLGYLWPEPEENAAEVRPPS